MSETEILELQKRLLALELFVSECFRTFPHETKVRLVRALDEDARARILKTYGNVAGAEFVKSLDDYIATLPWFPDDTGGR